VVRAWYLSVWFVLMSEHFANVVFFLLWMERTNPNQMWGGIELSDAINSLAAIMGCDPKELRELI